MDKHNPPKIDTETLKQRLDEGSIHVVEVLLPQEFKRGHIPGAIHIHFSMIGRIAAERFSKDDAIATYCHDERCKASRIAAGKLQSLGYTEAYHYHGGKRAWTEAGYPLEASGPYD